MITCALTLMFYGSEYFISLVYNICGIDFRLVNERDYTACGFMLLVNSNVYSCKTDHQKCSLADRTLLFLHAPCIKQPLIQHSLSVAPTALSQLVVSASADLERVIPDALTVGITPTQKCGMNLLPKSLR